VELDDNSTVNAIQVNFADNESNLNPDSINIYYCYRILGSNDGKSWDVIIDKSNNTADACHDYTVLEKPVKTKFIKIENIRVPAGKFSVSGLRIFGLRDGKAPAEVSDFSIKQDEADTRKARLTWQKDDSATGYIVNYGTASNKLYTSVMVYDIDSILLTGLNKDVTYYYSIDAFNESGITKGIKILKN